MNDFRHHQSRERFYQLSTIIFSITFLFFIHPIYQLYFHWLVIPQQRNICLYYGFYDEVFDASHLDVTTSLKAYDKCKPCNFIPHNGKATPNSSGRDAILSFGANKLYGLFPFVRSLRTTGSKCRFFILVNSQALRRYSNFYYQNANECGVEFIDIGPVEITRKAAMFFRYYLFRKFLIKNREKIDRVIFCDLYDTVFQHDPFTTEFGNTLYFTDEETAIRDNMLNSRWLNSVYRYFKKHPDPDFPISFDKKSKKKIYQSNIINGGLQAGTVPLLIKFCTVMLKTGNKLKMELLFNDQGFLNLMIYSGCFKNKFNYTIVPLKTDLFASISHYADVIETEKSIKPIFGQAGKDGTVPGVLHQYDRSPKVRTQLIKACPNDLNLTDYIRSRKKRYYIFKHGFNF